MMRKRIATWLAVVVAVLALAGPAMGDGGWGAGGACLDPPCARLTDC